jgi:hypothetical protein
MQASSTSGAVTGAATKTIIAAIGAAAARPKLKQVIIGASATPADGVALFAVRRFTADGTGTAGTVFASDPGDGTPRVTTKYNYSAEPTYASGNLAEISMNQRATIIWNAPLDGEITSAIGTANGIGIQQISGATVAFTCTIVWDE